jgi:hypothetical protein
MQTNKETEKRPLLSMITVFFVLGVLIFGIPGKAMPTLSWGLFPESQTVGVGQPFQLDLVVSGLGDGVPPSLEGFDVDITFSDVFTIDASSVVFGSSLGDPNNATQTQTTATLIGTEVLFLREDSLLDAATLDGIQGPSFVLASMTFTGSEVGNFLFSGDDFAGGLFLTDGTTERPGVTSANVSAVPEPATLILLSTGIVGLAGFARKKFPKK